ncbi:RICIN domain-containing protein [Mitsuaria sp. 7]|uniref:RICIN domain-containing protein n=1 Tax=Mitsuaria sp. 7 TaxID=1658665 RepID=UPI000830061D|nr:RICIN domain-containing protein [Mitsuaria sp. 7]
MAFRILMIRAACAAAVLVANLAQAIEPTAQYPGAAPGATRFLDKDELLAGFDDPAWFKHNIPFLDVPDAQIQQIYYFRWQSYKGHLVYTGSVYGWLSSEFLEPVDYGAPYGGISAAAGHHINEGRWLRNHQYVKDIVHYWLNGPGQFSKPMNESVNKDTSDWAHEYSFWAATSVWQVALATGDRQFAINALPHLVRHYRGYDTHFNATLGLYWQVPVWDATEYTPASYESSDPYHGGAGYRPTINAYQYGDARAIAAIARLAGNTALAEEYNGRASALQTAMNSRLWDSRAKFYFHMHRDDNPAHKLLTTRELQGFVPWMFHVPTPAQTPAMAQLLAPQGFKAPFGPTTAERRSKWFNHEVDKGCCRWNGPSWPYETAQVLTAVANLLIDYPKQSTITAADYVELLHTYAATQYRDGEPYVAEAHDADADRWLYDSPNHSEDYNHSTFVDNVISGLIGVRGQAGDAVRIKPLAPASWDYFLLENTPYHGHNLTVLWDRTGKRYGQGAGFKVYVDGVLAAARGLPTAVTVAVPRPLLQDNRDGVVNLAANTQKFSHGAQPFASFTGPKDSPWKATDGIVFRTGLPQNSRWTSSGSPHAVDDVGVDFQRPATLSEVRLTFYDDQAGVRLPANFDLQYWDGKTWLDIPGQTRSAVTPNAAVSITFPKLTASKLRVSAPNGSGTGWGLSELQAFGKPVFQFVNVDSGGPMVAAMSTSRATGAPAAESVWELVDAGAGWFKIRGVTTGDVLSAGARTKSGQKVGTTAELARDGDAEHLHWALVDAGGGQFKIRNRLSGQLLGQQSHHLVMSPDAGVPDQLWKPYSAADSRP